MSTLFGALVLIVALALIALVLWASARMRRGVSGDSSDAVGGGIFSLFTGDGGHHGHDGGGLHGDGGGHAGH